MNIPAPGATGQRILLWLGIILVSIYGFAQIALLELWPAPGPLLSAQETVDVYAHANTKFRFGVVLMLLSGGFLAPLSIVWAMQMARVEKGFPYLATLQLFTGVAGAWVFLSAALFFGVAAFTVERSPEITEAITAMAWFYLFVPGGLFTLQIFSLALVAFIGKQDDPHTAFPRWFGWCTFMFALQSTAPPTFAVMFKDGPLAWDGLVTYYMSVVFFGLWIGAASFLIFRAIRLQEQARLDERQASTVTQDA